MPTNIGFNDILKLLESYNQAFMGRDAEAIAAFYMVPTLTIRGDGTVHVFTSSEEVKTFFQDVVDLYFEEGVRNGEYRILSWQLLGEGKGVLTVQWVFFDAGNTPIRQWDQTYNLILEENSWIVYVSTFH